jgi:hypothetical protein
MEPYGAPWLQPAATSGKRLSAEVAETSQNRCRWLPPLALDVHGKEGVDGSSPSEGLPKVPANRHFVVAYPLNTRTHSGHI